MKFIFVIITMLLLGCSISVPTKSDEIVKIQEKQETPKVICDTHERIIKVLKDRFREELAFYGVDNIGNLVELYSNAIKDTWTIIISKPRGPTCVASSGTGWQRNLNLTPKGPEA